jgi:serine/threonine-protein kinase
MRKLLLISGLFIVVVVVTTYVTMNIFIKGEEVTVPSVVGLKLQQASDVCFSKGLNLKEKGRRFDDSVPEDSVIYQEPQAGDVIKKKRNVYVYISKGSRMTYVPDLYMQPLNRVNLVVANSGLGVNRIARAYSDTVPVDKVITQNPSPMEHVKRNTSVNLLVSKGAYVTHYLMPDFVGKNIGYARKIISRIGTEKIKISFKKDDRYADEIILSQNPAPNAIVNFNSSIEFEVNGKDDIKERSKSRYLPVSFNIPKDDDKMKRIKMVLIDDNGRKEIFNEMRQSGSKVETYVRISGEAEVEIYINGELFEEKKL